MAKLGDAPTPSQDSKFWPFLNDMGSEINIKGWTKYLGDMGTA